jgi:hypothetical protein
MTAIYTSLRTVPAVRGHLALTVLGLAAIAICVTGVVYASTFTATGAALFVVAAAWNVWATAVQVRHIVRIFAGGAR